MRYFEVLNIQHFVTYLFPTLVFIVIFAAGLGYTYVRREGSEERATRSHRELPGHRGLPSHPHGQSPDRVNGFIGMEAGQSPPFFAGRKASLYWTRKPWKPGGSHHPSDGDAEMQFAHGHAQKSVHGQWK